MKSLWIGAAATVAVAIVLGLFLRWSPLLAYFAAITAVTLIYYGLDKLAAQRGMRRIPERTLHVLALLGGAAGALLGQRLFRHKTAKPAFQRIFWLICAAQVIAIALVAYFLNR